jgi:hypothetical protein
MMGFFDGIGSFFSSLATPLMMLGGGALDIFGQLSSGRSAAQQGKFEYEIAKINATNIEAQGAEELRQATEEAELIQKLTEDLVASQIAGFTTSGVTLSGTVPVVLAETAAEGKLDEIRTIKRGMAAEGLAKMRAQGELARGKAAKFRGRSKEFSSYLGAGGTALTGLIDLEREFG